MKHIRGAIGLVNMPRERRIKRRIKRHIFRKFTLLCRAKYSNLIIS